MAQAVRSYRDLLVWQRGMDLAAEIYRLTGDWPVDERFGLTSQARRAAASVPANIAEGYGRQSTANYLQFLRIARGSLKELETHLLLASRVQIAPPKTCEDALSQADQVGRMLNGLITSIQKSKPRN